MYELRGVAAGRRIRTVRAESSMAQLANWLEIIKNISKCGVLNSSPSNVSDSSASYERFYIVFAVLFDTIGHTKEGI